MHTQPVDYKLQRLKNVTALGLYHGQRLPAPLGVSLWC